MIKVVSNQEQTKTGPLPIAFNSDGTPLTDYKLYGTSEGAGEETESGEPAGFKIPISLESGENLFTGVFEQGTSGARNPMPADNRVRSNVISLNQGTFICRFNNDINYNIAYDFFSSADGSFIKATSWSSNKTFTMPTTARALRVKISRKDNANFTPSEIEGFEILEQSNYDLFIGSTKLGAEEYVDYGEQKIYREVDGVLTPTDPPVPLPELSTYSGENTLSCSEALGDESQISFVGPVEETITKIMRTEDDGLGTITEHVLYKEGS